MSEDREQEREGERESAPRPVTAAARRERRASARPASRKDSGDKTAEPAKGAAAEAKAVSAKKGTPTPSQGRREDRKPFFQRIYRFLREVIAELRKVIWPTRKQLIGYSVVVLVFVSFIVALVAGLDFAFAKGVFWLLG